MLDVHWTKILHALIELGEKLGSEKIFVRKKNRIMFTRRSVLVAGWFSVVSNNSGTGSARVYRRVGALVRAGVPAFLLAKPLRAYTLTHSKMGKF